MGAAGPDLLLARCRIEVAGREPRRAGPGRQPAGGDRHRGGVVLAEPLLLGREALTMLEY
jgi:hypothetical protein